MNEKNPAKSETKEYYQKLIDKMYEVASLKDDTVKEEDKPIDEAKKKWDMNDRIIELFANNIKQDQKLRSRYAIILIAILGIELLALLTIFILKGVGLLSYSDTTFNIFVSGGIAEVFILVRVIVKYLFKDNLTEALKIIITNNNKFTKENRQVKFNKKSDKP